MIETTRDELHDEVWAEPMTRVAERYGISDVALKKVCNRHRIPTPPRGYWARRKVGKKDRKKIYRQVKDPALNRVIIGGLGGNLDPEERNRRKASARQRKQVIERAVGARAPGKPGELHPAAERFHARMIKKRPDYRGFACNRIKSGFRSNITPASVERATGFLSAFARTIEAAGHRLESSDDGLLLRCDGEDISFELIEKTDRRPHVLTLEEEIKRQNYQQYLERERNRPQYDKWRYGDYVSEPLIPEFDDIPNGQLVFRYRDGAYDGLRRNYSDGKRQTIEKLLPDIVAGALCISEEKKKRREERRLQELEWKERERIARQERRLRNLEKARVESMEELRADWKKASRIRGFIEAVKARAIRLEKSEIAEEWIEWASSYADRLDPLQGGVPKLAKMEDFSSWQLD